MKLKYSVALAAMVLFAGVNGAKAEEAGSLWNGMYISAGGGASFLQADEARNSQIDDNNNLANYWSMNDGSNDAGAFGAFGTVGGGFNMSGGSALVGRDASYDMGKAKYEREDNLACYADEANCNSDYESSLSIGNRWSVGGRLGILASDNVLLFASAGYTQAKVNASATFEGFDDNSNNNVVLSDSSSEWADGYYVGGGIEAALSENVSVRAEYRYADYGSISLADSYGNGSSNNYLEHDFSDITEQSVRMTLAVHF